jgi:hypothetical protein
LQSEAVPHLKLGSYFSSLQITASMKFFLALSSLAVAFLSMAAYRLSLAFFPQIPCDQDPPIEYGTYKWNSCRVFSLEYHDAREKFRGLARHQGAAEVVSLPVVDDYTIDVAIFPGTRSGAILHTSGTHGIEGYAGSAIQLALLESMGSLSNDRPALIFVHAVNPYGMANYRRFNEHNVDLNRNSIPDFPQFLKERDPNIAGYDDFREFVSPAHEPSTWESTLGFWAQAIPLLLVYGYSSLKQVLVAGQYHHAQGIFYGGTEWEPSITQLVQFLESRQLWDDLLVHIDVHTGLGKMGKDTLMFDDISLVEDLDLRQVFPTAENVITPKLEDKKAMAGYGLTRGMVPSLIDHKTNNCLTVTQEFGTLPGVLVGRALILENALHHHGKDRSQGRQWIQQAFYLQSTDWRASIVQRGVALIHQAIEYSKSLPAPIQEKEARPEEEAAEEEIVEEQESATATGDLDDYGEQAEEETPVYHEEEEAKTQEQETVAEADNSDSAEQVEEETPATPEEGDEEETIPQEAATTSDTAEVADPVEGEVPANPEEQNDDEEEAEKLAQESTVRDSDNSAKHVDSDIPATD